LLSRLSDALRVRCSVHTPIHSPMPWLVIALSVASCSRSQSPKRADGGETLSIRYEGSAGVVSVPELAEDLGFLAPVKLEYVGNNATGGPHSIQAVVTGDVDFGSSFNGAIVKLVAAKAPLKAVIAAYGTDAQNYQGTFVLEDSPIKSAKELVGKQVSMNTLGAHAEFAMREFLTRGGLSADQAKHVAMIALPAVNGELALREKQVDAAVLGSIHRQKALARGGLRRLTSDYDLFGDLTAGSTVMSTRFIERNPTTTRKFVDGVGRALDWLRQQPRQVVVARFAQIIERRKRNEDVSLVKHWTGHGVASARGVLTDRDFQIWIDWLIRDGQIAPGQVKAADVYTNAFQPQGGGGRRDGGLSFVVDERAARS
jgi:ABC-type nitrate/sulfonate/bicarbonate transport system substrate-binding protein